MRTPTSKRKHQDPSNVLVRRAEKHMNAKEYWQASNCYSQALLKSPTNAYLYYCKGVALHHDKQLLEASSAYTHAIELNPQYVEAFENLAEAQNDLQLFEYALISLQAAIAIQPKRALAHTRISRVLTRLGRYEEAIQTATKAIQLAPKDAIGYMIRSNAYRGLNLISESVADLQFAISLDSQNADFVYNLSFDLLLTENFTDGWRCYESRFKTLDFIKNTPIFLSPRWLGKEDIEGKTILIYPEQGLGDQIQFGRYALVLHAMGAKVIMPVEPPLVNIMQSMHPEISVISALCPVEHLPAHDFHIPLMSLLGVFKTELSNIPSADRYISPPSKVSQKWQDRFKDKSKLQIGLTWSGSARHVNDHNRSMMLSQLAPLFKLDAEWHILQTEIRPSDEEVLPHMPLIDWRAQLYDMEETAGLLDQLDLLITVDTSVAHLSAALGRPTWLMLPFNPDFRWLLERADSPWYPSLRLFRQSSPQNWNTVVTDVFEALIRH